MICFRAAAVEASFPCSKLRGLEHLTLRPDSMLQVGKELSLVWGFKGCRTELLRINGGDAGNPRNGVVSSQVVQYMALVAFLMLIHLFDLR
jgi:hypothetical protein